MKKTILFGQDAKLKLLEGINTLADAVRLTLGPMGKLVVIDRGFGNLITTKDGATIAKEMEFKDLYENAGASIIKEAALKTCDNAGDGTTTATVLAQSLINEAMNAMAIFYSPKKIKKELIECRDIVLKFIEESATPVNEKNLEFVASVSANDENVGKIVADAYKELGKDGVITVEESASPEIEVKTVKGMQLDKGMCSPYFATDKDKMETVLTDISILVTGDKIESSSQILKLLEAMSKNDNRRLMIVADEIRGEALQFIASNHAMGHFSFMGVNAPFFAEKRVEFLEDLAASVGAKLYRIESGAPVTGASVSGLGKAKKVTVTNSTTTIVEGAQDEELIAERVKSINGLIKEAKTEYERKRLEERLARLVSGVGVIKVGATTEAEMIELKHRIEDAVLACRSALRDGVVAGAGTLLVDASRLMPDTVGGRIMRKALEAPFRQLCENAHIGEVDTLIQKISSPMGYDWDNEKLCNLLEKGVIDPALVTKNAVRNAVACAITFASCESVMIPDHTKEKDSVE